LLYTAPLVFPAVKAVGRPKARSIPAHSPVYLANSPKSNAYYMGIKKAQQAVRQEGNTSIPLHLRNAPTHLMKKLNYGKDYLYTHDYPNNFVEQEYLPDPLTGKVFYEPANNPQEQKMKAYLNKLWKGKYGY